MLRVWGDSHSRGFYQLIAAKLPAELTGSALSETRYRAAAGEIKKVVRSLVHIRASKACDAGGHQPKQSRGLMEASPTMLESNTGYCDIGTDSDLCIVGDFREVPVLL